MPGKCHFKEAWLYEFELWVKKHPTGDTTKAYCSLCKATLDISSMGRTALTSHVKTKKHKDIISMRKGRGEGLFSFVAPASSSSSTSSSDVPVPSTSLSEVPLPSTSASVPVPNPSSLQQHMALGASQLKAEAWWAFNVVNNNYSYSSNTDNAFVFRQMYPDSYIAQNFQMSETKTMYVINHGISPYLESLVTRRIRKSKDYVLLFDESLNKDIQKKQMDILVRSDSFETIELTIDQIMIPCIPTTWTVWGSYNTTVESIEELLIHIPLDDIFRCIFVNEKFCIWIKISLKFVFKG